MQIKQKLEFWKNRLLDLSKRNRLINCTLPKPGSRVSRTSILIYKPTLDYLWNLLTEGETALQFQVPANEYDNADNEQESMFETSANNTGILTNQSSNDTYKTLQSLMKKAREFTEEKGLNALYIAFGFLNWNEKGSEGQIMRSPLILVPVLLSQESFDKPIFLSRSDEEITMNQALEQRLWNDFGIVLPRFDEVDDLQNYFKLVSEMCSHLKWKVEYDSVQLSLFSFLKINMYRDLEKNADIIAKHKIIRALNGENLINSNDYLDISSYNHDMTEPQDVFSVVDADSSQQDAILLAKRGVSFVLQGPPGTGKSQTITNIIAELIADGKKVLFVSEKMAALDVVYKRLMHAELSSFCLTLHNHKSKRREILDQLDISLKLSRSKVKLQQEAFRNLHQLKNVRTVLNSTTQEMHTIVYPLGKTIYQVNGILASYSDYKNIDYIQDNSDEFTPELLARCEDSLEELSRIVSKSGYQKDNPWNGCVLTNITHEFRQQFLVDSSRLLGLLENGQFLFNKIIELTEAKNLSPKLEEAKQISDLFSLCLKLPETPLDWLNLDLNEQIGNINICTSSLFRIDEINKFIRNLESQIHLLINAINVVVDCINVKEAEKLQGFIDCFILAGENFTKLLPNQEISTNITIFLNQIKLCSDLIKEYYTAKNENKDASDNLAESIQRLNCEEVKLNQRLSELHEAQNKIFADFTDNVVLLDAENMLSRYNTIYRSGLRRFFSNDYRNDRKTLLSYSKIDKKMIYHEALVKLESIYKAQNSKVSYDIQSEIQQGAMAIKQETEKIFIDKQDYLQILSEQLSKNQDNLQIGKQFLIAEIEHCLKSFIEQLELEESNFLDNSTTIQKLLGVEITDNTNFYGLKQKLELLSLFKEEVNNYSIADDFRHKVCARDEGTIQILKGYISELTSWEASIEPHINKFGKLFDNKLNNQLNVLPFGEVKRVLENCSANFASLEYLIDYRNAEQQLRTLGIDEYLNKAKELNLSSDEILPVFIKCFYRSWLDEVSPRFPTIYSFRRERQDSRITQFKELDKSHMEISKATLQAKLISRLPNFDTFSANSGEIALLRREMSKQRKLMPTRKLISEIPNLLPLLKPCILMSPLSVSTYLGSSAYEFDTVIFDEASQIRTEDAICSIFRVKQAIIAGDSKQLPPTDFFSSTISDSSEFEDNDDYEENDTGAYESLLDEAAMLPTQMLRWHYRSKHENLIAFSNTKIYQGNLITFPSSVEKSEGIGVEYIYIAGGTYDRGGRSGNKIEADQVADQVFAHFEKYPNRSLGIIAFGEIQQGAIEEAINKKRRQKPQYELYFNENREEPLFIKNLETVQGDERDTIIFSIGYAPDTSGKFIMNFGPLSRNGGERRLNVAVTRARYNMKLLGSILPTDIDTDRTSGLGPKYLRLYIDFAINGTKAIMGENSLSNGTYFDSPFEESVYNFLITNGYDVVTQVGCSGYRIDLAIRHPKYNGRYAIGIECDGAAYHSARTARERDRLRQTVLEDMGWKIYRVWSTDWIKDQHTEGERVLKSIESAIDEYKEIPENSSSPTPKTTKFLDISSKSMHESIQEKYKNLKSSYVGYSANDIPLDDFEKTMLRVIASSVGLDKVALFKETAQFGYLWQRQGSTIKLKFEQAFKSLQSHKKIKIESTGIIKLLNAEKRK